MLPHRTKKSSPKFSASGSTATATGWSRTYPLLARKLDAPRPANVHLAGIYSAGGEILAEYRRLLRERFRGTESTAEIENELWVRLVVRDRRNSLRKTSGIVEFTAYLGRAISNCRRSRARRMPTLLEVADLNLGREDREAEARDLLDVFPEWIDRRYSKAPVLSARMRTLLQARSEAPTLNQTDLARRIGVNQATVSRTLQLLHEEAKEFLNEGLDPHKTTRSSRGNVAAGWEDSFASMVWSGPGYHPD